MGGYMLYFIVNEKVKKWERKADLERDRGSA